VGVRAAASTAVAGEVGSVGERDLPRVYRQASRQRQRGVRNDVRCARKKRCLLAFWFWV